MKIYFLVIDKMGCTTSIKLTDEDKELLQISINDKDKFSIHFNYLANLPTLSKQDKRYLEKQAYQHLQNRKMRE